MANQTLAALRELTEAVMAEFFGNDTNLSKRLIKATNEAQLLLMVQPPDDDRVNQPAPAELTDEELRKLWCGGWDTSEVSGALKFARAVIAADRARRATPPAEGEVGELAEWLYYLADQRICKPRRGIRPHPSSLTRTGVVLQQQAAVIQQQAAELAMLRQLAAEIRALVSESDGVAGLHLNGDLAPWDELLPGGRFERLTSLPSEDRPHG